jgi:hypothetical protein
MVFEVEAGSFDKSNDYESEKPIHRVNLRVSYQ